MKQIPIALNRKNKKVIFLTIAHTVCSHYAKGLSGGGVHGQRRVGGK